MQHKKNREEEEGEEETKRRVRGKRRGSNRHLGVHEASVLRFIDGHVSKPRRGDEWWAWVWAACGRLEITRGGGGGGGRGRRREERKFTLSQGTL